MFWGSERSRRAAAQKPESDEDCGRLARRDRRVIRPEDLKDEEIALIAVAKVPPEYDHLDAELVDWQP
jgi:hypothetical protein